MNIQSLVALTTGQDSSRPSFLKDAPEVSETDTSPSLASATDTNGEEFSTFLTLLTAQIRNQDPLAPLDSTQFVEQLATFTNLELQAKGNAELENIAALLAQSAYATTQETQSKVGPESKD